MLSLLNVCSNNRRPRVHTAPAQKSAVAEWNYPERWGNIDREYRSRIVASIRTFIRIFV